jgi:TRAP-type C4-dicarboxylate transport system substrate-binding protein
VTVVNLKDFNALDKATQDAVLKAAAAAEARGWAMSEKLDGEYIAELKAKGMTIAQPSADLQKALADIGTTMTAEWLKAAGPDGQAIIDSYRK